LPAGARDLVAFRSPSPAERALILLLESVSDFDASNPDPCPKIEKDPRLGPVSISEPSRRACKFLITTRAKRSGQRWTKKGH
jgi:hypothetical protein